jgi:hypothetical protein
VSQELAGQALIAVWEDRAQWRDQPRSVAKSVRRVEHPYVIGSSGGEDCVAALSGWLAMAAGAGE